MAHGFRAQLRSGSLLTGALFVAFDFFPDAPPATIDWSQDPAAAADACPGQFEAIEANVASIIKKIDQMPIKGDRRRPAEGARRSSIRRCRARAARSATSTGTLDNADKLIAPNSLLGEQLGSTLQEVNRAARALRVLADYLERHPEALIRGKPGEAK